MSFSEFIQKLVHPLAEGLEFGYWGKPSSTVDWCEPNYSVSHYIAEFFNTFSSLAMVFVGLVGIAMHWDFEARYKWAFGSVAVVGIGSAAFHGTLLFSLQMLDELPMIYSSLILAFCIIQQPYKHPRFMPALPIGMAMHALIATILVASPALAPQYASPTLQFFAFHISFALLEIFLLYKATVLWQKEKDPEMRRMHIIGAMFWGLGILCWVLDFAGCETLWEGENSFRVRYLTGKMSVPNYDFATGAIGWSLMTVGIPNPQLHSWWHIFASSGLYYMTLAVTQNRVVVLGKKASIEYYLRYIPYVKVKEGRGSKKSSIESPAKSSSSKGEKDAVLYDSNRAQPSTPRRRSQRL